MGARIAEARRAAGMSQNVLAARLGVSTRTIQNYESGKTGPYRHLRQIAQLADVTESWLAEGEGPSTPLRERIAALASRVHELEEVLAHNLDALRTQRELLESASSETHTPKRLLATRVRESRKCGVHPSNEREHISEQESKRAAAP
jgi:HTH-type transcriptional regulator, cell division transcriptional repressor